MDPEDLRTSIPALEEGVYLNTGASGPCPESTIEATTEFVHYHEAEAPTGEGAYPAAFEAFEETRERVAAFLGASPAEIALTHSTADGISRVAASVEWEPGDVVVRTDLEHSAGVLPWWNLERKGVETRVLETAGGRVDRDAYKDAVADARLVCFNSITWSHGTRLPVADLVDIAHDAGALVLVDAVQSPGQTDVDVTEWGADFAAGAGHKWLLGPWGAGFLHVREEVCGDLQPAMVGYRSVEDPDAAEPSLKPGAARLEVGTTNPAPYVGLQAAMDLLDELGMETVESHIAALTDRLKEGLGERCLSPADPESGLVTFTVDDPEATVERLASEGIVVRSLPYPDAVRASLHVFNTPGDVDALLDAL
ncbi:aminotransferase class V-fold PLP-dependent enzyme [Halomarina ordinaria]|uniref:Aminotransferase class V-fold PLP-dependent enzyme n=1 Tax=Halomarina ordinaria TaxID=3033939 RepID=A0ABD5U5Q7_9EURY|nr:aminotransferase class V-fold PLP-dependent enzyme [Halomarina sp. PSRA2]